MTDTPQAAAHIVARLVARDGRVDWREIEFLDRTGAFALLGIDRGKFGGILAACIGEQLGKAAAGASPGARDTDLSAIRDRRLQLLVAALLVYVAEIDRKVEPGEQALVQRVFDEWRITPRLLQKEMRVPLERSLSALGRLPQAA